MQGQRKLMPRQMKEFPVIVATLEPLTYVMMNVAARIAAAAVGIAQTTQQQKSLKVRQ